MRIGLFGFTFSHENMGCQALTCSFLEILSKVFPNEYFEIIDFFTEKTLGDIPSYFPNMDFFQYTINLKRHYKEFKEMIESCDLLFDISYGDGFSDIYFGEKAYRNTFIKYLCGKCKTPYILAPQTYGPFRRKTLKWLAGKVIRSADVVYSRDNISTDYATKISNRDVINVTDLAFALPYKEIGPNQKIKFGINVSGLLWQGGFDGKNNQFGLTTDYKCYCTAVIDYAISKGYEIHLIPHVTKGADSTRNVPDSDYPVCQELKNIYNDAVLAPCFTSPYDAKNYISSMNIFIGARMHSTIAALSSDVLTIPFAYSRKFQGLFDNLGYKYCIDGTKLSTKESINKTISYLENPNLLIDDQTIALKRANNFLEKFERDLYSIIINRQA